MDHASLHHTHFRVLIVCTSSGIETILVMSRVASTNGPVTYYRQ